MSQKRFDFVIFGATGFTGEFVVEEMVKHAGNHTWAVAGRSEEKLKQTMKKISQKISKSLTTIPIIIADVANSESISVMARQAKVVLNTVGPYRWYGEVVVKACIDAGTDHVDISGEPQYLENMALKYNEVAKKKGVYIVGACGWDSIPCDVGIQYAIREFNGQLDSVETVAEFGIPKGTTIHYGTFQTMVYMIAHRNELTAIRQAQKTPPLPASNHKPKNRGALFWHEGAKGWCVPFMGSDASVVDRTMHYNYDARQRRPVQVKTYMKVPNIFMAFGLAIWGALFFLMCSCKCGRYLLLKYPKIFTAGTFSHEGPTQEQIDATTFRTWIFGTGWKGRKLDPEEQVSDKPNDRISCVVDGPEPGYAATSSFLVASAFTLLEERENLPTRGGVFPPGAAFATTKIYERLTKWGISFKTLN